MKSLLFFIVIMCALPARAYETVAICDKVVHGNYRNQAATTIVAADITLIKTRTGYRLNEEWDKRRMTGYQLDLFGLHAGCDSRPRSHFEKCIETKRHIALAQNVSRAGEKIFATYAKDYQQLHITSVQHGYMLANVVLQCRETE